MIFDNDIYFKDKNNEKILFEAYSGSLLYGTNTPGKSDIDIKGVFLPNITDLILNKAPKHYTSSTGEKWEKNTENDIDKTYYSLHYFLELAAKGDTNALDILFAYTNKNAVLITSKIWQEIINNLDKILTKNVKAYLGYCKSQCIKYSVKGEKLNNFFNFKKFLEIWQDSKDKNGAPITLFDALNLEFMKYYDHYSLNKIAIPNPGERIKILFSQNANFNFGEHCYIETAQNKESYLTVSDIKFQLNDSAKSAFYKVNKVINSYGKRAEAAANKDGVDYKAISHCVRVLYQTEELLTLGKITFPLQSADFIKSIKYNTTQMTYEEIMNLIEKKIKVIDERLLPNCTLREKADYKWIETFILNCYGFTN